VEILVEFNLMAFWSSEMGNIRLGKSPKWGEKVEKILP